MADVLEYAQYRNFEAVIEKAKLACFNSVQRIEDHFVDVTDMVQIGSGAARSVKTILMSRYACYLIIQNADPKKEIVALGQTYFAIQTRRQELADQELEDERRLMLREELKKSQKILEPFVTNKMRRLILRPTGACVLFLSRLPAAAASAVAVRAVVFRGAAVRIRRTATRLGALADFRRLLV